MTNVNELYVVCNYRKQLSIPLQLAHAIQFGADWSIHYSNLNVIPYVIVRSWCGV